MPSVTAPLPERAKRFLERRCFPFFICWGGRRSRGGRGTEAPPRPVPVYFAVATRCTGNLWFSSLFYTSRRSPPAHWTFSPSYLCQIARACLDCPIRVSAACRHRVIPGQTTAELLPGQRHLKTSQNISTRRFSLHDLSLQEGKRQIPLARLCNLLLLYIYMCIYIYSKKQ